MAAVMHHVHVPVAMSHAAHQLEKVLWATLFALVPPVAFALLILSGLLLALAISKVL
jgi:hypothetical protein